MNKTSVVFTEKAKEKLKNIHIKFSKEQIHNLKRIKI